MNRIEEKMMELKKKNEKAFITYITAGLPDKEGSLKLIKAQEKAGCDVIELGIPFSDPVADGPIIQEASYKAIQKGVNLHTSLELVSLARKENCNVAIVFMLYSNTIFHEGIEEFVKECTNAGVDGLIIPDLPLEEQGELQTELEKQENAPILIQLVSPVSKKRIPKILEKARGFVYCVSSMGVTGQVSDFHRDVKQYLSEVKQASLVPVMMGFGISAPKDVKPMLDVIDGCIVGSHFIKLMEKEGYAPKAAEDYIRSFKREMQAETGSM